jgi:hypothetical protein
MVAREVALVIRVQRGFQEHPHDLSVSHLLEPPVRRVDLPRDDSKARRRNLFAQQVVFRIQRLLVETA